MTVPVSHMLVLRGTCKWHTPPSPQRAVVREGCPDQSTDTVGVQLLRCYCCCAAAVAALLLLLRCCCCCCCCYVLSLLLLLGTHNHNPRLIATSVWNALQLN